MHFFPRTRHGAHGHQLHRLRAQLDLCNMRLENYTDMAKGENCVAMDDSVDLVLSSHGDVKRREMHFGRMSLPNPAILAQPYRNDHLCTPC